MDRIWGNAIYPDGSGLRRLSTARRCSGKKGTGFSRREHKVRRDKIPLINADWDFILTGGNGESGESNLSQRNVCQGNIGGTDARGGKQQFGEAVRFMNSNGGCERSFSSPGFDTKIRRE